MTINECNKSKLYKRKSWDGTFYIQYSEYEEAWEYNNGQNIGETVLASTNFIEHIINLEPAEYVNCRFKNNDGTSSNKKYCYKTKFKNLTKDEPVIVEVGSILGIAYVVNYTDEPGFNVAIKSIIGTISKKYDNIEPAIDINQIIRNATNE